MLSGRVTGTVFLALALGGSTGAAPVPVGGGGSATTDCLAVFLVEANTPASAPRNVRCTDGGPCDADGVVNGSCQFPISVCANSTFDGRCTLAGVRAITVDHAVDNGDPKFDPDFQALQARIGGVQFPTSTADQCTVASNVVVPVKGPVGANRCRADRKRLRMVTQSVNLNGVVYTDTDHIRLVCDPAPTGCDPRALFSGTFDRIQRQIFDRSCALSGCHDSQTKAADMLLEASAAYTNLVNVVPTNAAAAAAGWKRVTTLGATSGDPATSLLFHKITGDLADGFGSRMPFGRRPLDPSLIDVIQLWIAAGAPATDWVPGTD